MMAKGRQYACRIYNDWCSNASSTYYHPSLLKSLVSICIIPLRKNYYRCTNIIIVCRRFIKINYWSLWELLIVKVTLYCLKLFADLCPVYCVLLQNDTHSYHIHVCDIIDYLFTVGKADGSKNMYMIQLPHNICLPS